MKRRGLKYFVCLLFMAGCISSCGSQQCLVDELQESIPVVEKVEVLEDDIMEAILPLSTTEYARLSLTEAEQLWYQDMKRAIAARTDTIRLDNRGLEQGLDYNDVDKIFQSVESDHPEFFYIQGYSYVYYTQGDALVGIDFNCNYETDYETTKRKALEIESAVRNILTGVTENMDQYEKVKYVYETIILNTDYRLDAPDNQNMYSVLVGHSSVCQGYAKATQYLLERLGMECLFVRGLVRDTENHSWNMVKIDGEYYCVDVTWGDPSFSEDNAEQAYDNPVINYDYLNITTEEISRTHSICNNVVQLPDCIATEANYFRREDYFLQSYNASTLRGMYHRALEEGGRYLMVKCADRDCYEEMLEKLFRQNEVFSELVGGHNAVVYFNNDQQLTMTLWVTN